MGAIVEYYNILGIDKTASPFEIKKAYRKKAKQYHPDLNPGKNTADHFIRIKRAYDTLLDPVKRENYDDAMCYTSNRSGRKKERSKQDNYNENAGKKHNKQEDIDESFVSDRTQLISFSLAGEEYAFKIFDVKSITGYDSLTPPANSNNIIEGMVRFRGEDLPVIDLAKNFGFAGAANPGKKSIVIVEIKQINVGFIIDSVPQVLNLSKEMIFDLPDIPTGKSCRYTQVGKIGERIIIILDLHRVFSPLTLAMLKEI